jgi:hypothetical protein
MWRELGALTKSGKTIGVRVFYRPMSIVQRKQTSAVYSRKTKPNEAHEF